MKGKFVAILTTSVMSMFLLGATQQAHATTYTPDTLLGSADLGNSGDATELAALKAACVAGGNSDCATLAIDSKVSSPTAFLDDVGNWVIDVSPDTPGYFLLKFGTGGLGGVDDTYFFKNIAELTALVFTNAMVNFITGDCGADKCNIGRLSHYTTTGGTSEIPVPGALPLLLTGIGGLGFLARRRAKKA